MMRSLDNLEAVLADAGMDLSNIIRLGVMIMSERELNHIQVLSQVMQSRLHLSLLNKKGRSMRYGLSQF